MHNESERMEARRAALQERVRRNPSKAVLHTIANGATIDKGLPLRIDFDAFATIIIGYLANSEAPYSVKLYREPYPGWSLAEPLFDLGSTVSEDVLRALAHVEQNGWRKDETQLVRAPIYWNPAREGI